MTFLVGVIPFLLIYYLFEKIRGQGLETTAFVKSYIESTKGLPISSMLDGFYGLLLSPGRNLWLYSPLLLIPFIFWHKIKKEILPELVVYILLAIIYIGFYATAINAQGEWVGNGEYSWGPRYLIPVIPFGMIIVGHIYSQVTKKIRYLIFLPLALIGMYVEILGILMPYQIKFHDLQYSFTVNQRLFSAGYYINFLPQYSPIYIMSKNLIKLIK